MVDRGRVIHYTHPDGQWCVHAGNKWWYAGGSYALYVNTECHRDHYVSDQQVSSVISDDDAEVDRGEFGHPGVGSAALAGTIIAGSEIFSPKFDYVSEQAFRVGNIFDEAQTLFRKKNAGYGDTGYVLGAKGQFADINRKVGKLKHMLWDDHGDPDNGEGESMEEVLMDLMGHAALTVDYLRIEEGEKE